MNKNLINILQKEHISSQIHIKNSKCVINALIIHSMNII